MPETILITGGTGFIGSALATLLQAEGYTLRFLSRTAAKTGASGAATFIWDPEKHLLDPLALEGADYIVHLAGTNIGGARWTDKRKALIVNSRVQAAETLCQALQVRKSAGKALPKAIIAASACGLYGPGPLNKPFIETDPAGTGFQAETVRVWENALQTLSPCTERQVILRFPAVLGQGGGAFPEMMQPITFGLGSIGSGKQPLACVHLTDVCRAIAFALSHTALQGVYNTALPTPATNADFVAGAAKRLHKTIWLPHIPAFLLRLALGEMAALLTEGNAVSSQKIEQAGFAFKYPSVGAVLDDLVGKG